MVAIIFFGVGWIKYNIVSTLQYNEYNTCAVLSENLASFIVSRCFTKLSDNKADH